MREIKFRGRREDDGKWVIGDLTHVQRIVDKGTKPQVRVGGYNVDEKTVQEYTGFKDKEGTPIFEGDIVEFKDIKMQHIYRFKVVYHRGSFGLLNDTKSKWVTSLSGHIMDEYIVVGNIVENIELLNE